MSTHIEDLLNEKIEKIKNQENVFDSGKVIKVKDYIIEATGLENVKYFEKVNIWEKGMGYVNQINENSVTIAIVKEYAPIVVGDIVNATGEPFKAIFAKQAIGRIVDIFGVDLFISVTLSILPCFILGIKSNTSFILAALAEDFVKSITKFATTINANNI